MTSRRLTFILATLLVVAVVCGCSKRSQTKPVTDPAEEMKVLLIAWEHSPEKEGSNCENCLAKRQEIQKAYESLKKSLPSLGIEVAMKEAKPKVASCPRVMTQSSGIIISDRPLESWLGANLGKSTCGKSCGGAGAAKCVSLTLEGQTYDVIPAHLIVKAGLIAASDMLGPKSSKPCPESSGCTKQSAGGCGK